MISVETAKSEIVDVIETIEKWIPMFEQGNAPAVLADVMELLDSKQAEIERLKEQQPKKGEWLKDYTYRKDHPRNYCSVCNMTGGFRTDYCPNCGAYMRKDGEQECTD